MSENINVDISEALKLLTEKHKNSENFVKILEIVKKITKEGIKKSFDNEQSPDGEFWKKSKSPKTLQKTKALYFDMQADSNYQINNNSLEVFTSVLSKGKNPVFYGSLHNEGTKLFVKRQFAGLSKESFTKILNKIQEEI